VTAGVVAATRHLLAPPASRSGSPGPWHSTRSSAAAVVLQALRAARNDLEHPHDDRDHGDGEHDHAGDRDSDVSAETRPGRLSRQDTRAGTSLTGAQPPRAETEPAENLADALVQICADYLSARAATAGNPDTYQVIIHAGTRAVTGQRCRSGTRRTRTAATINPPHSGERLNLSLAIWIAFANARTQADRAAT
jgi:hypothetical protein